MKKLEIFMSKINLFYCIIWNLKQAIELEAEIEGFFISLNKFSEL